LWGIASNLIAKHHRQETRMYRALARTGVDPAEDGVPTRRRVAVGAASRSRW
jgi:RNA polymerase sigma-70 factor (ECF subfamily)